MFTEIIAIYITVIRNTEIRCVSKMPIFYIKKLDTHTYHCAKKSFRSELNKTVKAIRRVNQRFYEH
jgi:hypothetical protein